MKRWGLASVFLWAATLAAPVLAADSLTDQQVEGRRFFQQSCGICHTKPTLTSPVFGPVLSKATFAKGDDQPKKQIAEGSPNMPGYKYHFTAGQIDAIVAYLKSVDAPPATTEEKK